MRGDYYTPSDRLDVGLWTRSNYEQAVRQVADDLCRTGRTVIDLQPGNGTAYRFALTRFVHGHHLAALAGLGRARPVAVCPVDGGWRGFVFDMDPSRPKHEDYVAEKLGATVSDGWVMSRFLTALAIRLSEVAIDQVDPFGDPADTEYDRLDSEDRWLSDDGALATADVEATWRYGENPL